MNKTHLPKSIGTFVRLEPPAESPERAPLDDDWLIADVDTAAGFVELANSRNSQRTRIALDGIYSFHDDANRTTASKKFGFLVLLVQVEIAPGGIEVRPLPSPRQPARGRSTHPSLAEPLPAAHVTAHVDELASEALQRELGRLSLERFKRQGDSRRRGMSDEEVERTVEEAVDDVRAR